MWYRSSAANPKQGSTALYITGQYFVGLSTLSPTYITVAPCQHSVVWGNCTPAQAVGVFVDSGCSRVDSCLPAACCCLQVKFHPAVRVLVFDVLFNVALRMNLSKEEVDRMALVCVKWSAASILPDITSDKFKPIFDEGMKARCASGLQGLAHVDGVATAAQLSQQKGGSKHTTAAC